jgi:hypothetical protein
MNRFGSAAAMSYTLSIICFMLTFVYIKLFMGNEDSKIGRRLLAHRRKEVLRDRVRDGEEAATI